MKNGNLQEIEVAHTIESKTNQKGDRFTGPAFDELVDSIRQSGVLMPVLARKFGIKWEVIAGNRRLAASKKLGLKMIPARVVEMTDVEARQAQIVENLQRADLHPLEEGESYRQLIEESKPNYTVLDVAIKVGKSERYVRDRLGLTNLSEKASKAFREGEIGISQAILISKLEDDKQQKDALKHAVDYAYDAARLKEWIQERVYTDLGNRPWAKDAKLSEMLGDDGGKESLFGKTATDDPVEYGRKMAAYIEIMIRKANEKGEELVKICTSYGTPDMKGVLARNDYRLLESKEDIKKSKEPKRGIVAEGENLGRVFWITTAKDEVRESTAYRLTPEEKAKRKADKEAARVQKEKEDQTIKDLLAKLVWVGDAKILNALFEGVFEMRGTLEFQPACRRHGIEVKMEKKNGWESRDYEAALRAHVNGKGADEKFRLMVEVMTENRYYPDRVSFLKTF